eukprot:SAG31_NODE_3568_length_4117_cov_2.260080_2_plen_611_part_00
MDPSRHADFLWIAEAARDAVYAQPLPAPWKKLRHPKSAEIIYFHPLTEQVLAVHPAILDFKKIFKERKRDAREAERMRDGMRRMTAAERAELAMQKRAQKLLKQENRAALRLQKVFRGRRCRMQVELLLARRYRAATAVQAGFRGMGGRRLFWNRRREWAAIVFQKRWRGRAWRLGGWKELRAVGVLQRGVRQWRARKADWNAQVKMWVERETEAVRVVQASLRRRAKAQRAKRDYVLLAVVDASKLDESFFEAQKTTTGRVYGMRIFHREAAIRRGIDHLGRLQLATRMEVPFMVRLHASFRAGSKLYAAVDYHPLCCLRMQHGLGTNRPFKGMGEYVEICRVFAAEVLLCLEGLATCRLKYGKLTTSRLRITASGHVAVSDRGLLSAADEDDAIKGASWCFGCMLLELLTGIVIPSNVVDPLLRKQIVQQAGVLVERDAAGLLQACLLPGPEARGLTFDELRAHPYFEPVRFANLWTKRPFGLSGPTELLGKVQVQRQQLSHGAATLERRLADITLLGNSVMHAAAQETEAAAEATSRRLVELDTELTALKTVAVQLRGAGRIKEYRAIRKTANEVEKLVERERADFGINFVRWQCPHCSHLQNCQLV